MYKNHVRSKNRHNDFDISSDIAKIKAALIDTTRDVRGKAGELFMQSLENAKDKTVVAKENVADYISEKPLKSVGIAVLAGLVIGFLIRK